MYEKASTSMLPHYWHHIKSLSLYSQIMGIPQRYFISAREFPCSSVVRPLHFPCPRAWVQFLARELRSRKQHGTAKK